MTNSFIANVNKIANNMPDDLGGVLTTMDAAIASKQDKEVGKGLSQENYTTEEKAKLAAAYNYVHPSMHPVGIIDGSGNAGMFVKTDGAGVTGFGTVSWSEVQGKPSAFVPDAHTHGDADITSVDWSKIVHKPSEFTPEAHVHTGMDITSLDWSKIINEPVEYPPSSHHHDITDVVTGDLSATRITETQDLQFVSELEKTMISGSEQQDNKGIAGGYVPLDNNGKIPSAYIPSTSVVDTFVVDSEAAMLGIPNASAGDIAIRSDLGSQFVLKEYPASILANWVPLITSSDVLSVNGKTGVVSLVSGDITEAGGNLFYTTERVQGEIAAAYDAVGEFTNKTIDSHLNKVGANHIHYKVKALENLAVGDVVKIAGYQNGEDAIRVVKTTSANDVAIGVVEHSISNGEFGLVVNTGTVDGIDTSAWTFGTILYHNGNGGLQDYLPTSDMYQACAYVMRESANNGSLLVEFTEPRVNYVDADLSGLVL